MDAPGSARHWEAVETVFHAASALTPEARPGYVAAACEGRPTVARDVNRLLAAVDRAEGFIAGLIRREADEVAREAADAAREATG